MTYQKELFKIIRKDFNTNKEMHIAIGELFNITPDAVKKIAYGKTALSHLRQTILVNHFNIPEDKEYLSKEKLVELNMLTYNANFVDDFLQYARDVLRKIERLGTTKDASISISADEIPVFHTIRYPRLTCFKLYCFAYDEIGHLYTFEAFMRQVYNDELKACLRQIADNYLKIPSTEIWRADALDSMLHQIPYMMDLNAFAKWGTARGLTTDLKNLLADVKQFAQQGEKSSGVGYTLCRRDYNDTPPSVLAESSESDYAYVKMGVFNYISLSDERLKGVKKTFDKIKHQCTLLRADAVQEQAEFFRHLQLGIKKLEKEVKERK